MEATYEDIHYVMVNMFHFDFKNDEQRLKYELKDEDLVFLLPKKSSFLPKVKSYHVSHIANVLWHRGLLKERENFYKILESSRVLREEALV